MSLTGKTAIVTGAGRGIGAATAIALAGRNVAVSLLARTPNEITDVVKTITAGGGQAQPVRCDVTLEQQVQKAFDQHEEKYGRTDIVINNAGALILKSITATSLEEWEDVLRVNLTGAFLVAREALRRMGGRGGTLINVGSMAGRRGYAEQSAYCASKHGLAGLTKVLAIEGQPKGVRVHLVSPGGVMTDLSKELRASRNANADEWMSPAEVADAIVFCAMQTGVAVSDEVALRRFQSEPWR
ncbi:MAG: SDR family oxidoreductase [Armatimonadetes bacterium]|nr:SDR family oxidoreductase [Armatimonadota bacterium]